MYWFEGKLFIFHGCVTVTANIVILSFKEKEGAQPEGLNSLEKKSWSDRTETHGTLLAR